MNGFWYQLLDRSTRLLGTWLFVVVSRCIAACFFFFSRRRRESVRFYRVLFPDKPVLYHLWCVFRQYQNFTTIHLDRFLSTHRGSPSCTADGLEHLDTVIGRVGGILLMSHLGNWELAAHLLKQQKSDLRMLLYMGIKEKEGVERLQKEALNRAGIEIIGVGRDQDSPFSVVEGMRFLESGGLLSMTGDVVWQEQQRVVEAEFLGHRVHVPAAPYVFSLLSGAPLFVFFSFRTGSGRYHFTLSKPITVRAASRADRDSAIQDAARKYLSLLEDALRAHPFEWYHFDRFLREPLPRQE